ncbi:hypothetical protein GE21DRAFT_6438 [Neurospora crassa]|uniref:Uncharacterized protein n=1 Tax=Neurospora crassa (strain ATCC 24698 / 74-OR23-1A / CBS 708.71 / DSM 1257 / FGSC 987) TaxID=367110 RepID=V5IML1_NEUCR|nr:hypothetical protein NCU16859 [Neurospora crassa OR74A]ESA43028.1 hypothetical protein NCU16859 [Neurospora crassa OR74A]KHE88672.1 hypothetical protein GE21DRAFT_6438 [Neurospora crassa]|eukprot:XP_011394430.1 hypothetical protein NCU16859 [Neurospora crassa OR74A]
MLMGKMLKLSQQLNKLSKPILVYLAALQDVPVNPIHIATAAAATTTTTTTTSYYVASTCTESPTAVCHYHQIPQYHPGGGVGLGGGGGGGAGTWPTPFPFAYSPATASSSSLSSVMGLEVWLWWSEGFWRGEMEGAEENVLLSIIRSLAA